MDRKIGILLKEAIASSGRSIESISFELGFTSPRTIYRWMNGEALPSFTNFLSFLRVIGSEKAGRLVSMLTDLPFYFNC